MKKKMFTLVMVMIAIIAVSCGKKADEASVQHAPSGDKFYYTTFADAKVAAGESGKAMVLDFYTDW